jgi:phage baseplate assembly protein V
MTDLIAQLRRLVRPLETRVANMVTRAVIKLVDDSMKLQTLQLAVLTDEVRDDIERVQNYGFTSVPLEGAEAAVVFVGGRRDHGLAVAVDDRRYRVKDLKAGEVAVYTDQGDKVVIKRGGTIEVTAATKVVISTPIVELGTAGATEAAIKGTTFRTHQTTLHTTLAAQLAAAGAAIAAAGADPGLLALAPVAAASLATAGVAVTAASVAPTTFESSAAATVLSTKVKVG